MKWRIRSTTLLRRGKLFGHRFDFESATVIAGEQSTSPPTEIVTVCFVPVIGKYRGRKTMKIEPSSEVVLSLRTVQAAVVGLVFV